MAAAVRTGGDEQMSKIERIIVWIIAVLASTALSLSIAVAFGPIPKADQCISVNALLQRNCAPVYMCNGAPETNADWCCSMTRRWWTEEQRLKRWYKRNCHG